jgi:hypothetical protein
MMANQRSTVTIVGVSGLIAIASALPMLGIVSSDKPSGYLVALAFRGLLLSIAVSGNAHAFTSCQWFCSVGFFTPLF